MVDATHQGAMDQPEDAGNEREQQPAIEAMVPHDQRDYQRVGLVILCAGIVLHCIAWHFFGQDTPRDLHAGLFFASGGLLLNVVGGVIAFRAFFGSSRA